MRKTGEAGQQLTAGLAGELKPLSCEAVYRLAGRWIPRLAAAALACGAAALYIAFFVAPTDPTQGEVSRILFVHVPAAWISLVLYFMLAVFAAAAVAFDARLPAMIAGAIAPTGALLAFLTLWTGAIWGKPTWGAWWTWDARLTCMLLLLFLYLGYMAFQAVIPGPRRAERAAALFGLAGAISLPLVYFPLQRWNGLHPGAWASAAGSQGVAAALLAGMLLMTLALLFYGAAASLSRLRSEILEREQASRWVAAQTSGLT